MAVFLRWVSVCLGLWAGMAQAQDTVWVQIEAQPSLREAEDRLRVYDTQLPDVAGFSLGNGWYGIALGPYDRITANSVLTRLRATRAIPGDSYIALPSSFRQQIWPIGAGDLANSTPTSPPIATAQPLAPIDGGEETVQEARASERLLTEEGRKDLQRALAWAGFYRGGIDGAYGRGTRSAMSAWQEAQGLPATGVLTTSERAALLAAWNAVFDGLGLARLDELVAGISMEMPLDAVALDRYEAPFAHFEPTGPLDARVILISQEGSRDRFAGLYRVLQTLDILPEAGPRELRRAVFEIEGFSATRAGYAHVRFADGQIKGFILDWPAGDEDRRVRVRDRMLASFAARGGVMPPEMGAAPEDEQPDLLAGLALRAPERVQSGLYVDGSGLVATTPEILTGCTRVTIGPEALAEVVTTTDSVALLRATNGDIPLDQIVFQTRSPRIGETVFVAGHSYGGLIGAPSLSRAEIADQRGPEGRSDVLRLAASTLPGDVGGAVLDARGTLVGILLPRSLPSGRILPEGQHLALRATALAEVMAELGSVPDVMDGGDTLAPLDIAAVTQDAVVTVNCWN